MKLSSMTYSSSVQPRWCPCQGGCTGCKGQCTSCKGCMILSAI